MIETLETLDIKLLTPIWTGGAEGSRKRVYETGIIGSLRWWYEVVIRGLGGYACDLEAGRCGHDEDKYRSAKKKGENRKQALSLAGLCAACQVFGNTGWRKRFQLEVIDNGLQPVMKSSYLIPSLRVHNGKSGGWYILPGMINEDNTKKGIRNTLKINIHWSENDAENEALLLAVIHLMVNWTAIGARTHSGYGVSQFSEGIPSSPIESLKVEPLWIPTSGGEEDTIDLMPALTEFFFCVIRFMPKQGQWWKHLEEINACLEKEFYRNKSNVLKEDHINQWLEHQCFPLSPIIRNWLRFTWGRQLNDSAENFIFGTASDVCPKCYRKVSHKDSHCIYEQCRTDLKRSPMLPRVRSKIGISHAYSISNSAEGNWEFRLWGYLPGQSMQDSQREIFLNKLRADLLGVEDGLWSEENGLGKMGECQQVVWREFNSVRDTTGVYSKPWEFFQSLVRGDGLKC